MRTGAFAVSTGMASHRPTEIADMADCMFFATSFRLMMTIEAV